MNRRWIRDLATVLAAVMIAPGMGPTPAGAALSERGGSGVFEVQSAESKRPGRLELGIFGAAQRLALRDPGNSRFNALSGGVNAGLGLPGGFEASGTVPAYGYYLTTGGGGLGLNDNIAVRLGDVAARMRWTQGFLLPGMRWGFEGEASFPTGNDRVETFPNRTASQPFTLGKRAYTGRAMLTWDGLRAGSGVALRLHANGAYTFLQDEGRFVLPRGPLPLELPAPARKGDNDVLSLGAAVELDLARLTLFTEAVTDQFVNERGLLTARENRIALTPGVRFWIPGGLSVAAAYSMDLSRDDARTAFDPGREFPDHEWRVALSLGTIYRGRRARAEDDAALAAATQAPVAPVAERAPAPPGRAVAVPEVEPVAMADSAQLRRQQVKKDILERRPSQASPIEQARTEKALAEVPAPAAPVAPVAPSVTAGAAPAGPAARPKVPAHLVDTDGDGIPDVQDQCPLMAEDWDGFQDYDGCPDLDNDGDGIPDTRDACPNDPETYNGYYDFDGCPDGPGAKWIGPEGTAREIPRAGRDSVRAEAPAAAARPLGVTPVLRAPGAAPDAVRPAPVAVVGDTIGRRIAARAAAPGAGDAPARASTAREDSLALMLDAERRRSTELAAMFERTEAERRQLLARVMTPADTIVQAAAPVARAAERPAAAPPATAALRPSEPVAVVPPPAEPARPAAAGTTAPPPTRAESEAISTLGARLDRLERMSPTAGTTSPPGGATVVNVPRSGETGTTIVTPDRDVAARLAALEREIDDLRRPAGTARPETVRVATPAAGTVRASAPGPGELESRFGTIESRLDSLAASGTEPASPAALDALLPPGVTRTFREVRFETGSTHLTGDAVIFLTRLAALVVAAPDHLLRITGHTDDVGLAENNLRLSRERAMSVARLLEARGIAPGRLIVEGRGEEEPVASNTTAAGREANRRVTFTRIH